jgi:aryl sulfotransferase|tara:strand:- start:2837 stop:3064 length:228 start_codon:yes stop_codon:yes gene_type:complete
LHDANEFWYEALNATPSVPLGGAFWDSGAETFVHKGSNGRWMDVLSDKESTKYETMAVKELGDEYAHWFKTGKLP